MIYTIVQPYSFFAKPIYKIYKGEQFFNETDNSIKLPEEIAAAARKLPRNVPNRDQLEQM